jgi:hypothetical protein
VEREHFGSQRDNYWRRRALPVLRVIAAFRSLEDRAMRGQKHAVPLSGHDPETFKWVMIAAVVASVITAGVVRFGPERAVTGADHQRIEQTLRGAQQN